MHFLLEAQTLFFSGFYLKRNSGMYYSVFVSFKPKTKNIGKNLEIHRKETWKLCDAYVNK